MWKRHPRLSQFHAKWCHWAITLEGTLTWWASDDIGYRERKLDHEVQLPKWPWRLYCLKYGHEDYYGDCVYCGKPLVRRK